MQPCDLVAGEFSGGSRGMNLCPKERLAGVNIPQSGNQALIEQPLLNRLSGSRQPERKILNIKIVTHWFGSQKLQRIVIEQEAAKVSRVLENEDLPAKT
jgi:hypothetical protein